MKFCCGSYDDRYVPCGPKNSYGTVTGSTACNDPAKYIFWDGVHYTEAAIQFVAKLIINGSLSDPPVPLAEACSKGFYS
ncbi:hypothetical protein RHMOL_Rhmol08G0064600 [Rhododendron molle]|uniref:Uncharacterized protein n=1 Tax=Rhododendron molle TaxID=49168 RepID=A0ACC0MKT0_RHOML|nr:hypothetical protein RHMOL_Rhmol08G0064600 [Rhododendron molle]